MGGNVRGSKGHEDRIGWSVESSNWQGLGPQYVLHVSKGHEDRIVQKYGNESHENTYGMLKLVLWNIPCKERKENYVIMCANRRYTVPTSAVWLWNIATKSASVP